MSDDVRALQPEEWKQLHRKRNDLIRDIFLESTAVDPRKLEFLTVSV